MFHHLREMLVNWLRPLVTPFVLVYWLLMFVATHIPNPAVLMPPQLSDKVLHAAAYFVLYSALSLRHRWIHHQWPNLRWHTILLALTMAYACCDELLQALPLIGRHADWRDWLADCAGLFLAALAAAWIRRRSQSVSSSTADSGHGYCGPG